MTTGFLHTRSFRCIHPTVFLIRINCKRGKMTLRRSPKHFRGFQGKDPMSSKQDTRPLQNSQENPQSKEMLRCQVEFHSLSCVTFFTSLSFVFTILEYRLVRACSSQVLERKCNTSPRYVKSPLPPVTQRDTLFLFY